ncbi:MAG TPA: response regulator, partial [candidate division Zixibacteria bacterium]|nr:response regulator [candidate division Zixibacteria bacterium]
GEQYSEAIIGTIEREKPAVVNQNAEDSDGRTFTNISTLVFPLEGTKINHALILRRQSSPFALENFQLRILSIFARLAVLALSKSESEKLDLTRRMGFDKVVQLLRLPSRLTFEEDPGFFARHLASLLPQNTGVISFVAEDGAQKLADIFGASTSFDEELIVKRGEGFVGKAVESGSTVTISGKKEIERALDEFSDDNQIMLSKLIGEFGSSSYAIIAPLKAADKAAGVVAFFLEGISDSERREWERLITLACGLYSMKLSVASMSQKQVEKVPEERINQIVNAVNNNLAGVIGNAEILMTKNGLENELRAHLQSIVNEAEIASNQIKSLSISDKEKVQSKSLSSQSEISLNEIAEKILKRSHVSENLYMMAGRAREIELKSGEISNLELAGNQIQELFTGAINKFAALAAEDDIITISTYERDNAVYLDISRHRRNLPPVESVAGFGSYQVAEEALKSRPADKFLEKMAGSGGRFAYDRFSTSPSYLSFKFPLKKKGSISTRSSDTRVEILAVDDQPVILELISAMCQTLGFRVTTALSGAEALSLAKENKFDVILTDLAMPGMSGLELSRLLRIDHPDTPIILITGWEATIERSELESSGISDILYKPFRIEQLTNLVKAAATGQKA